MIGLIIIIIIIIIQVREGLAVPQENLGIEWLGELVICSGFFLIYLVRDFFLIYLVVNLFLIYLVPNWPSHDMNWANKSRRAIMIIILTFCEIIAKIVVDIIIH